MAASSIAEDVKILSMTENELRVRIHTTDDAGLDWTPDADTWSLRQIMGHMADAELAIGFRLRKVLAEQEPSYPAFDEEAWTARENHAGADIDTLYHAWEGLRRWHLSLLEQLTEQDLQRKGHHFEAGEQTLAGIVRHMANHDRYHLGRMNELFRAQGREIP